MASWYGRALAKRTRFAAGRIRGFGMFLLVAARLSSAVGIEGNSVSFEVTDRGLVSAICPSPVWNESRQALEYPPLQGVLFGRLLSGASGNASHTVWSPLNATCNCSHNESLPANSSQQTLHTTYAAFIDWISPTSRETIANLTLNSTTNESAHVENRTTERGASGQANVTANYTNVTCADSDLAEKWCRKLSELRNLTDAEKLYCNQYAGPNVITVVVNTEIVVINNVTQVVQITGGNSSSILEREINAFLSSFTSTGLLYDSNVGIGQFANIILWIGFFVFCLFSIVLEWISTRKRRGKMPISMLTLQSALTTLGYLTMAFGHGRLQTQQVFFKTERNMTVTNSTQYYIVSKVVEVPLVPPFFYVRYLMWMLTTPTELYLLCDFVEQVDRYFASLAIIDVAMIICGMTAAMSDSSTAPFKTWIFFVIGVMLFVVLAARLLGPLRNAAYAVDRLPAYSRLLGFVLVSWSAYPVIWLLSDKGLALMSTDEEVCLYVLADVVSKVGFSMLLLYLLRTQARPSKASYMPPAADKAADGPAGMAGGDGAMSAPARDPFSRGSDTRPQLSSFQHAAPLALAPAPSLRAGAALRGAKEGGDSKWSRGSERLPNHADTCSWEDGEEEKPKTEGFEQGVGRTREDAKRQAERDEGDGDGMGQRSKPSMRRAMDPQGAASARHAAPPEWLQGGDTGSVITTQPRRLPPLPALPARSGDSAARPPKLLGARSRSTSPPDDQSAAARWP